ncbi:B3/B4 domain-containing protein [Longivirga aurantiaca]|uniref:B3/4 domain-containing protein n=1 Tax=Longivirga aurantiaca TaxID=1837743 RepID=A0ABW1SZE2_9ACTN
MTEQSAGPLPAVLAGAAIDDEVHALVPGYRALLIAATGVRGGPSDERSDAALRSAEGSARARLDGGAPESLPEIAAWRDAFLAFGVKPRQARSSVEALVRRVDAGLPRIDRLTDLYNAVSVEHLIPIGGENLARYAGPPRLVRAVGDEPFDTVADGELVTVSADPGEVLWRDDLGATCRRWNWRQCVRTRLDPTTTDVLFILDGLDPLDAGRLHAAGEALVEHLRADAPAVEVSWRLLDS